MLCLGESVGDHRVKANDYSNIQAGKAVLEECGSAQTQRITGSDPISNKSRIPQSIHALLRRGEGEMALGSLPCSL